MVTADGAFTIDWDAKLAELRRAAAQAYVDSWPYTPLNNARSADDVIHRFDWIPAVFDRVREFPSPRHSQALAEKLVKVTGNNDMDYLKHETAAEVEVGSGLAAEKGKYDEVENCVDDWTGTAATSFRGFFEAVPTVIDNQVVVAQFLGSTARANAILLRCARQDAEKLPDRTIEALGSMGVGKFPAGLSIFGAVAAIVGGLASLPAGGWGAVSGGISILAGISDGVMQESDEAGDHKDAERSISGNSVESILNRMCELVSEVETKLHEGETLLMEALQKNTAIVIERRSEFVAAKPQTFLKAPKELAKDDEYPGLRPPMT